jgi:hypothetical protein
MKTKIFVITLLALSCLSNAQEETYKKLLQVDTSWSVELFKFPISFAPSIEFTGMEEAVFPKEWSNSEHELFWSYGFLWNVNYSDNLSADKFEEYLQTYFDGLMTGVNKDSSLVVPKTNALVLNVESNDNNTQLYRTKIRVYDSFFQLEVMNLFGEVQVQTCPEAKKSLILFRFSLKPFDSKVWDTLHQLKLPASICETFD